MSAETPNVRRVQGYCGLCIARCGTVATLTDGRFTRLDPDPTHPTGAAICAKGRVDMPARWSCVISLRCRRTWLRMRSISPSMNSMSGMSQRPADRRLLIHIAMTTAANTPHTITNALSICFSSETDIASGSGIANDPGLAADRGRRSHECALRSGWGRNTCASVLNATKPDRTIVPECNGSDCTNSMMRCGGFTSTCSAITRQAVNRIVAGSGPAR